MVATNFNFPPLSLHNDDASRLLEDQVEALLGELTLAEKISLIHGNTKFSSGGVPRLGIPDRWLTDGPHGIREEIEPHGWNRAGWSNDYATALPISIGLAATWNPALATEAGEMLGAEARARKKEVFLAPGVNIQRTPLCGRTFEYLGEDPYLASRMTVNYIRGVQSQGVAACVKHLAVNNQEIERSTIDVEVDERTLREIYLPVFRAAVEEAGVLVVMGAYNKFRGQWCSHNDYLLNHILKGEWKFRGVVVSDWAATHDTDEAVWCGLDLEMGTDLDYDEFFLARAFREGIESGRYPIYLLDDKVRRNLRVLVAAGGMQRPEDRSPGAIATPAHRAISRKVAEEAIVLLKNETALLPLDLQTINSIAVIGENATRRHSMGGFGAGVKVMHEVHALEGITVAAGAQANVTFSLGWAKDSTDENLIPRAVEAAAKADVAIVFAGLCRAHYSDDESTDRPDLALTPGQDELIRQVVAANPRTVVVMISGSPVTMDPWLAEVPAVLQAWYGGVEAGSAVAAVLFGAVNPSGKLPCTFPKKLSDIAAHASGPEVYPGVDGKVSYREGVMVGYRHFDTQGIEPLFAFGHGLSYTTFAYAGLLVEAINEAAQTVVNISFELSNTGASAGAEIAQIYVQDRESSVVRPVKELKGFTKVMLAPGEKKRVTLALEIQAFMFFDVEKNGWLAESGDFTIVVGSSSRDLRLTGHFNLAETVFEPLPAQSPAPEMNWQTFSTESMKFTVAPTAA